ncbi:MAG: 1-acyl-sn-glycerol-3-phosphate acyltransferase [Bacteroidota bacterium]
MKLVLRLYFRKIRIEGIANIPKDTPLLVAPNHQNAFLDALLVGVFIPNTLHFLTRSDVFVRWSRPFFRLLNMIPIYRMRDGYAKLSLNDQVFQSCYDLFKAGKSVLIFPEGNHGQAHYLRPLTKGAARIALRSQVELENDLMILPVGLNYFSHQSPRSTVLIAYGEPIPVKEYVALFEQSNAKGLNQLRDRISMEMKKTLAIPDSINYEERKSAVFKREHEHYSLKELRSIESQLSSNSKRRKPKLFARLLNPLPYLILHAVLSKVDDIVFHSSLKLAIGIFVFPLWWVLIFTVLSFQFGTPIASLTVIVMVLGLFYSYD